MKTKHLLLTAFVVLFSYYAQADCRVDTIYSYNFITGTSVKEKKGRAINFYGANNQTQQLYQTWGGGSNSWKNIQKNDYTYDASNNPTQELSQTWDGVINSWKNDSKYDWIYDTNGCMLSEDSYDTWNASGSYYTDHTRIEYFNTYLENTGIAALNTSGFSVYPNPVNDQLTIQTENEFNNATATVIDIFGRVVLQEKRNTQQTIINTSTLNSGVYFLQINADRKSVTKKVVKN